MSQRIGLALFLLLCLAQLTVAGSGIARHERALQQGTAYRFETAPVDPLDLFRGRYVHLDFALADVPLPLPHDFDGRRIYAVLGVDSRGFARITALETRRPGSGDFLHVTARRSYEPDRAQNGTHIDLPFTRFYMEESRAPEAERRYRAQDRTAGGRPAYAIVRVLDGLPVLEDLHLED